jgi:hypothetical protein
MQECTRIGEEREISLDRERERELKLIQEKYIETPQETWSALKKVRKVNSSSARVTILQKYIQAPQET